MKHVLKAVAFATIFASLIGSAGADVPKPEETIKNRRASLTQVQTQMKNIGAMLKGERPMDPAFVAKNAALIEAMAKSFPESFPRGTDHGDTKARAEIWSQPDKWKQATNRYQSEATKFHDAARNGNVDALRAQFGALAKSCGTCHEDFRNK